MAVVTFRGDAPAVAQVDTITITAYDASTTYKITINGKVISTVGTGGTTATTAAALYALLAVVVYPEYGEVAFAYTAGNSTITATSTVAGRPFTMSVTYTGGTGTATKTSTTASSGPSDLSVLANYSTGALPSNGDTMVFENLENGLLYNVDALSAITTLARIVFKNIKAPVGLPNWNPAGYWEYRPTYVKFKATLIDFDCPNCSTGRLDNQTTAGTFTVANTGQTGQAPLETLLLLGTNAANILNSNGGSVAIAGQYSETAQFATVNQGYNTQQNSDSTIRIGIGCTLANVNRIGGVMIIENSISGTLTMRQGASDITIMGSAAIPTINHFASGASIFYLSSGTITTMTLGGGATFNSTRNQLGFVITNVVQSYLGASFIDTNRRATWAGIKPNGCGIGATTEGVFVDRGESRTWLDS